MEAAQEMLAGWMDLGAKLSDRSKRGSALEAVVNKALVDYVVDWPNQISHRNRVDFEVEVNSLVHGIDVKTSIKDRWRQPVLEQISMRRARGILSLGWESGMLLCIAPQGCDTPPDRAIMGAAKVTNLAYPFLGDGFVVLSLYDTERVNKAFEQMRSGQVIRV